MRSGTAVAMALLLLFPAVQCGTGRNSDVQPTPKTLMVMEEDTLINRNPAVAGTFYPGSRRELSAQLEKLFTEAKPNMNMGNVVALIAPHAGYIYSGLVAASSFNQLSRDKVYDNVFVIGSSHRASYDAASVYNLGHFITPLGTAKVNISLANKLIADNPDVFKSIPEAHVAEHSLEVQLPFLQYLYKDDLQIVPVLLGTQRPSTAKKIAEALAPYFNSHNLFVISTDFSHYPDYANACKVDEATANAILANSVAEFRRTLGNNETRGIPNLATSICGWTSVLTLLNITENMPGIHYHSIQYMNSGDADIGDKSRVVGYHAITVTLDNTNLEKETLASYELSNQEKAKLLRIARVTIEEYLKNGKVLTVNTDGLSEKLQENAGAFVSLHKEGKLRGCIGRFTADMPLYKVVQEMAISAAFHDHRFSPVTTDELNRIDIEISILTPMRKIQSINEIILGKHGIYIKKGSNAGTFLPQVAIQTGWNLEEFLGHCARDKAGLGWEGWKDADIFIYEAYVFGEH